MGQDVVGQNFVGQDIVGALSLGQGVSGAGGSGAGSRESVQLTHRPNPKLLQQSQSKLVYIARPFMSEIWQNCYIDRTLSSSKLPQLCFQNLKFP